MSKGEVQQLKSKIHKLEEEINERTRNYMIRQQYHQHKHHLHYVDRQCQTQAKHRSTQQSSNLTHEDLASLNEQMSDSISVSSDPILNKDHQSKESLKSIIKNRKLTYQEISEKALELLQENEKLQQNQTELQQEIEQLLAKYERQSRYDAEHIQELQSILQQTQAIEKQFRLTQKALQKCQQQLNKSKNSQTAYFNQYQQLRIVEYDLNQELTLTNKKHHQTLEQMNRHVMDLECSLKIIKAQKGDYELAYLTAKEELKQLYERYYIIKQNHSSQQIRFTQFFSNVSTQIFEIGNRLPSDVLFMPIDNNQLQIAFRSLSQFAKKYQSQQSEQEIFFKQLCRKISMISGIIVESKESELLEKLKQIEGYEDIDSIKEKIVEQRLWGLYIQNKMRSK